MSLQMEQLQDAMNYLCLAAAASISGAVIAVSCTSGQRENSRAGKGKSGRSKRSKRDKKNQNRDRRRLQLMVLSR
ncbi:uncharacterized protein CELE_Y47D9A.3 [Caenorhabditis elegans]|uniref:Secreted protein n=1 Tax=Caenorhabditis elegans TaxID=6239 RepID=Q9N4V6_CAEEL|nr:Secreted protein [Caenorhabditis elegans]CCD67163.1 Secreted protein [Caenorhabditis elegans]|eukprot:NP_491346.2 Uncharacterized protein CELE_Y47D9A.3 [Caenorhabditis elegans]